MEIWASVIITAFINLTLAAFVYGRLTGSVSQHEGRIGELEKDKGEVWKTFAKQGERIAHLEARSELKTRTAHA